MEAEGYERAMSPPLGAQPAVQQQDFQLQRKHPSRMIRGIVLGPDGRPAANASVALVTFEQDATLSDGAFSPRDGSAVTTTDAQGQFQFEPDPNAHTVVAADRATG